MLEDINTSTNDLNALIHFVNKDYFIVQLLFYNNGISQNSQYERITIQKAESVNQYLKKHGVNSYLSISAGQDTFGACGQLALNTII